MPPAGNADLHERQTLAISGNRSKNRSSASGARGFLWCNRSARCRSRGSRPAAAVCARSSLDFLLDLGTDRQRPPAARNRC